MRIRSWDLGAGDVYALDSRADLAALRPRLRPLVSRRMLQLFEDFPDSLERLALGVSSKHFAAWLRAAKTARPSISVYDPRENFPPGAFLELDFGTRPTAGGDLSWIVLIDCRIGTPKHCPRPLVEVYRTLGGIQTQYGASGTLISPREVRPLSKLRREAPHLFEMGLVDPRLDPAEWFAYFECDGDYLCYRADGRSRWFGLEWLSSRRLFSTRRAVDDLFTALSAKRSFNASEQAAMSKP